MRYRVPSFLLLPRRCHRSFITLFPLRRSSSLRSPPARPLKSSRLPNPPARRSPPFKPPLPPSLSFWHELRDLLLHHPFFRLLYLVTWAPVLLFLHHNVFQIVSVDGMSMYPLLNKDLFTKYEKDKIAVWLWGAGRGLKRGKVVMFW